MLLLPRSADRAGPARVSGKRAARCLRRTARALQPRLPRILLLVAAFVALSDAFAFGQASVAGLVQLLPVDVPSTDPSIGALSAVGLAMLVLGLARGKRLAWYLAVLTFGAGVVVQVAALGHPAGGLAAVICLVLLTLDRRSYGVRSARTWSWRAWALLAVGAAAAALETLVVVETSGSLVDRSFDLEDLAGTVGAWLSFGDPAGAAWRSGGPGVLALAITARLAVAVALIGILKPVEEERPDPGLRPRVRSIAAAYGSGALLPFQLADDKAWYSPPDLEAAVAYGRDGRVAVVVGDPFGRSEDRWAAFASFVDACRRRDWIPVIYQASEETQQRLAGSGFQASPIGREAIVDLPTFSLAGSRRANLRHTVTRARRGGVTVRWFPDGIPPLERRLLDRLAAIDEAWRRTVGPEMGFTISRFRREEMATTAVAVAVLGAADPIAFATFRPTGADGGWVLDLVRRAPEGVPGAMESCLVEAAERFRDAGATRLSLGLAPLSGLDPAGERLEERALASVARLVRPFYDVEGLAFFKNKFAPRWETRYVAVPGRIHLVGLGIALARLHLGSLVRAATAAASDLARTGLDAARHSSATPGADDG